MELKEKIIKHFEGKVVRKDLTKLIKGNAVVPSYVLEYLLGQHCATSDETLLQEGVEKVKTIIKNNFVHREDAEKVKYEILNKGSHKIIDKISAKLNESKGLYEAEFTNLGIKRVLISNDIISNNKKILTSGVWCIVTMSFITGDEVKSSPWIIEDLKPIQISNIDLDELKTLRGEFSKDEWIDLLMQSIGLNPEQFSFRSKLIQLSRLIPYCENNYNLIELGPKGTGKSHIYSEMSPHGMLISGGEVTQAKLFVNNSNGQIGLVGYWDNVAFDEFAGVTKKVNKALVDTMKNYMANKSFSRGKTPDTATASFSFVGNTMHSLSYMLRHTDLFEALPPAYYDTAFLDRIHCYIPGWEVQKLRNDLFTNSYGFIVDYLAEILKELRKEDHSNKYIEYFELSNRITTRDRDGILKTFSGLCKIIYPNGIISSEGIKEILDFAIEGRKRVKNQLIKMDETFSEIDFSYIRKDNSEEVKIKTLEEIQFGSFKSENEQSENEHINENVKVKSELKEKYILQEKHLVINENEKGNSYLKLFGPYLKNSTKIIIYDPYVRLFYQVKNLMEFIQMLISIREEGEDISLKLVTKIDDNLENETELLLENLQDSIEGSGINFEFEFDQSSSFHARSIESNTGWKISLDRGLDIFQPYDFKNPFNLANNIQEERLCKRFEVTYIKTK